ncbi:MAG: hypothetical protein RLY71_3625 [Pseudomonadota bacterium]|jgi:AcrR family transcriptional regulator
MQIRLPTEARQAEIVRAALVLACTTSPAQITTGQIAEMVGLTQGALFKHFPTKDAVWAAVMSWVGNELPGRLGRAATNAAGPVEALEAVFRAHVDFVLEHPGIPRLIFHELQQPADSRAKSEVRSLLQGYRRLLLELLERAVASGELAAGIDREAAATAFVGLIQGLVMQSMLSGEPASMRPQAERVLVFFLRGLGVRT